MTDTTRRRGRRPAGEDARAEIVAAARAEFAARGFDGATLRGIARAAGVDPRLVHHYFENGKEDLFIAAFQFPARPADVIPVVFGPGIDGVGERLVRFFFGVWDTPPGREMMLGLVRSAATSEQAAAMIRQFVTRTILARAADVLPGGDAELRVELAVAQMVGVAFLRYVIRVEPLASADLEDLVPLLAPTVQRYLAGE
ncbi:TetR/AcrR family transcriptional regulator [Kineosporia sp. A_224]|uniref:TetR/AcrR family transcriptional regulator n=1 Tax=Kineosporia sp. A_224 TaxID=1962180 RepID=UPI000B4BC499|nr:TetR family transcriptional regulator [Kineosporia sp. A_224]